MAVFLAPGSYGAGYQAFDTNGKPLNAGLLYTYAAGTTSPQSTYTTSSGLVANANPIVLGVDGRPQSSGNIVEIWLTSGAAYKFTLTDILNNQISVNDNLTGTNDIATLTEWVVAGTPTYVGATQFTLVGNQTAVLDVGRRVKAVVTAGTIYGTVSAVAFSTVTTVTVDWDSTQLDTGLSSLSYGFLDAANISIPTTRMDNTVETITAAATVDLSITRSRNVAISGSTTISRVSIPDGQIRFLSFNANPTISSTVSNILLAGSGNNISTVTSSVAIFRGEPGLSRMIAFFPPNSIKQPSRTVLTSGSGTYNVPTGATRVNARIIGGGGGGGAVSTNNGTTGNATTFASLTGGGGGGGAAAGGGGGAGGTAAGGDINIPGAAGQGGYPTGLAGYTPQGAPGGNGAFGGGGSGSASGQGGNGATNSGGGGAGGGGGSSQNSGAGGGAGGYVEKLFNTGLAATYSYGVGAAANGGAAGVNAGGNGAAGIIIIDEFYT